MANEVPETTRPADRFAHTIMSGVRATNRPQPLQVRSVLKRPWWSTVVRFHGGALPPCEATTENPMSDANKYGQELIDYLVENSFEFADYVAATGTPAQARATGGHEVRHVWSHTDKNGVRLHCFTNGHSYCLTTNAGVVISDEEPAVETDE